MNYLNLICIYIYCILLYCIVYMLEAKILFLKVDVKRYQKREMTEEAKQINKIKILR